MTTTATTAADTATAFSALSWFEIPVRDLDRAQAAYERVLGRPMRREAMGPSELAVFGYTDPGTGGCLMRAADAHPADHGTLVFLNAEPSLDAAVVRARTVGWAVPTPRVDLPPGMGAFAIVIDGEGNRIGLHAQT